MEEKSTHTNFLKVHVIGLFRSSNVVGAVSFFVSILTYVKLVKLARKTCVVRDTDH